MGGWIRLLFAYEGVKYAVMCGCRQATYTNRTPGVASRLVAYICASTAATDVSVNETDGNACGRQHCHLQPPNQTHCASYKATVITSLA